MYIFSNWRTEAVSVKTQILVLVFRFTLLIFLEVSVFAKALVEVRWRNKCRKRGGEVAGEKYPGPKR